MRDSVKTTELTVYFSELMGDKHHLQLSACSHTSRCFVHTTHQQTQSLKTNQDPSSVKLWVPTITMEQISVTSYVLLTFLWIHLDP